MRRITVVDDTTSRRLSPAFFVAALICLFFTFAGVSCDTARAKDALTTLSGLGGRQSGAGEQQLNACLNALSGVNLISYSGIDLALGRTPSELSRPPAACASSAIAPATGTTAIPTAASIGVQPLALGGLVVIVLGVAGTLVAAIVRVPARLRLAATTLLGALGFFLLLMNQLHVHAVVATMLNDEAAGAGAPFSVADYFDINDGIAWMLTLIALGAATLYGAAAYLGLAGPAPVPLEPPATATANEERPAAPHSDAGD